MYAKNSSLCLSTDHLPESLQISNYGYLGYKMSYGFRQCDELKSGDIFLVIVNRRALAHLPHFFKKKLSKPTVLFVASFFLTESVIMSHPMCFFINIMDLQVLSGETCYCTHRHPHMRKSITCDKSHMQIKLLIIHFY